MARWRPTAPAIGKSWTSPTGIGRSVTNVPGQSGQPESPFYGNLLPLWDRAEYFPLVFTRGRIDKETAHKLMLRPDDSGRSGRTGGS